MSDSVALPGTNRETGLNKDGIKVGAVVANMIVIGIGFLQFGKCLTSNTLIQRDICRHRA